MNSLKQTIFGVTDQTDLTGKKMAIIMDEVDGMKTDHFGV